MKVPYFEPWITKDDKTAVTKALNQRWLTNGPILQKFEKQFQDFLHVNFAIGVGSATHALHLAVKSLGIGLGDEVLVPTFTFAATANSVIYTGAKPVFVDVTPDTFTINTDEIKKKITKKTKAIIPVHYGGQACDMDQIISICKKNNLSIIEDCAHALGSVYKNKHCGALGSLGCFSFYPTKIITTGEGGMVTTNKLSLQRKIKSLKSHSLSLSADEREKKAKWKYDVTDLGYNYRIDEIRSALGLAQFSRIKTINKLRINIAKKYDKSIKKIKGLKIPTTKNDRNHIYHLYTITVEDNYHMSRDELFQKLSNKGIGTSIQYYPLHLMSYYKKLYKPKKNDFPNSNLLKDKVICLPIFPRMSIDQIKYVVSQLQ